MSSSLSFIISVSGFSLPRQCPLLYLSKGERDLISSFVSDIFLMANDFISPFQLSVPP